MRSGSLWLLLFLFGSSCAVKSLGSQRCRTPFYAIGGRCLFVDSTNLATWFEATHFCQNLGGRLAKIDDGDLHNEVVQYIKLHGLNGRSFWIGGSDLLTEGLFQWIDGSRMTMGSPFWGYNANSGLEEPNNNNGEDCVEMRYIYKYDFNDLSCTDRLNSICEEQ